MKEDLLPIMGEDRMIQEATRTIYRKNMEKEIIREIDVQNVMTKSSLPVGGFSVNPYVGCPHACKYCYASFMKRFTGHTEPWGTFLDVKHWKPNHNIKL